MGEFDEGWKGNQGRGERRSGGSVNAVIVTVVLALACWSMLELIVLVLGVKP